MAGFLFKKWKNKLLKGDVNAALNSTEGANGVYVALVDEGVYTASQLQEFYSEVTGIVATVEITAKTQVDSVFGGADVILPLVSGVTSEALIIYRKNTGLSSTWPIIAYFDSTDVANLPITPNGTDININWNASGVFEL